MNHFLGFAMVARSFLLFSEQFLSEIDDHERLGRLKNIIKEMLTSSGKIRVKSYTVAIVTPAWCFVARLCIISFIDNLPFSVGGGCRIRAGEFGGKPKVSI